MTTGAPKAAAYRPVSAETFWLTSAADVVMVSTLTSWELALATVCADSSRIGTECAVRSLMLSVVVSKTLPSLTSGTASSPTRATNATAAMSPAMSLNYV